MKKNKILYYFLIWTFVLLFIGVSGVSFFHAITFFKLTNNSSLSLLLALCFEIGQSSVLFSILLTENKNKFLPWLMMFLLTSVQITANVFSSFKFMDQSGSNDWTYWQRSILFAVQADSPEMYKVIISWISGGILPVIALGLTALVAENIKIMKGETIKEEKPEDNTPLFNFNLFKRKPKEKPKEKQLQKIENNDETEKDLDDEINEFTSEPKIKIVPEIIPEVDTKIINEQPIIFEKDKKEKPEINPVNKIRGWHLLKEFVDKEFNVFNKGKFIENDPSKIPTTIKKA